MVVGVDIQSSTGRVVTVRGTKANHTLQVSSFDRVQLPSPLDPSQIPAIVTAFGAHLNAVKAEAVGIRARPESGKYQGNGASFRLEGVLFTVAPLITRLVPNGNVVQPVQGAVSHLGSLTKVSRAAYLTAIALLP